MENNKEATFKVSLCILVFTNFLCKIVQVYLHEDFCYTCRRVSIFYIYVILFVKTHFFYSMFGNISTIVNFNQNQQQPNFFVTLFIQKVLILQVEIYTSKGVLFICSYIFKKSLKTILIAKSTIKFVKLNFLDFPRQPGSKCCTSVLNFSSTNLFRIIRI